MTARQKDLQRRALESSARKKDYQEKHSKLDRAKVLSIPLCMLISSLLTLPRYVAKIIDHSDNSDSPFC